MANAFGGFAIDTIGTVPDWEPGHLKVAMHLFKLERDHQQKNCKFLKTSIISVPSLDF